MQDSIPIHRGILKHWIYSDSDYFKVWVTMLSRARYLAEPKKGLYQNVNYTLNRGEFLFGRKKWNEDTGVSEQKLRTLIKKLLREEMIVNLSTTSKFTIFLIVNYENFNQQTNQQQTHEEQGVDDVGEPAHQPPDNQHLTSNQPASNQHLTTNKEGNKKAKTVKTVKTNIYTSEFESFWSAYPKKKSKNDALKAWNKIKLTDDLLIAIMDGLQRSIKCVDWVKNGGQFIPYPATWLNGERWTDVVEEAQTDLFTNKPKMSKREQQLDEFGRMMEDYDRCNVQKTSDDVFCELPQLR